MDVDTHAPMARAKSVDLQKRASSWVSGFEANPCAVAEAPWTSDSESRKTLSVVSTPPSVP